MKQCLVIAYAYPPAGGAGVQRTAKFVRYLPEFGWTPTVLTVAESCYGVIDPSHTQELPEEVEMIRTPHLDPVTRFTRAPAVLPDAQRNGRGNDTAGNGTLSHRSPKSWLRALARNSWVAFDRTFLIPDQAVLWCPRAVAAGLEAHFKRRFDLIYATGEPYSDYFTASMLSRLTGVPFVIDMRDPWTLSPYRQAIFGRAANLRQTIERWQERRVLSRCRACIFANPSEALYAEKYSQWADKFHYIPNGYDSADFAGVEPRRFDKFTLVHSGTFLPGYRTADVFLQALKELLQQEPQHAEALEVFFVGKIGDERKLIDELSLGETVRQTGYVPHKESLGYLLGADCLLLVGGKHAWEETGKIYEYLAAGKPVLALVNKEGAAARLLRDYPGARLVDRTSVSETRAALSEILRQGRLSAPETGLSAARQYERKSLTKRLAAVFDTCV